ncbi:hypothetical protein Y032_0045g1206 [Ancylostoma ceylanicum]|uniref:Uncharacterized protein n=1 Tax=Ancylostoma ceylanicum TaxID=53326 RepID=A0A016UDS4_9BILA|nr:hypothetical protein Y032_0045g1206 [Ancylostoma ceylanicum]
MRQFPDSSFLYTIISALATLAFACSSLICAQKRTNRQRIAGGFVPPVGAMQEVSLIEPTIKGEVFLQTAIEPSVATDEKSKGSNERKVKNKKNKHDKHDKKDKKKKKQKDEKPTDKKAAQKKEKKGEVKKEQTPMKEKTPKKEEPKKEKIEKHVIRTPEKIDAESPKKAEGGALERNMKIKSLEAYKTAKTEEDRKKTEEDKKKSHASVDPDDSSEKVDARLQSNMQSPITGQSLVQTAPIDDRLRSLAMSNVN